MKLGRVAVSLAGMFAEVIAYLLSDGFGISFGEIVETYRYVETGQKTSNLVILI